jgi:GT2 family glycosyltransferase
MKTKIAVIIVNWNKKQEVLNLLNELSKIPETVDIFVIDNASTDDSVKAISKSFPWVTVFENETNLGGTGGFNTGLDQVCNRRRQYSYAWLLDNDASIRKNTLSELVRAMEADQKIGLVGSRIVDKDNPRVTVETGGKFRSDIIDVLPLNRNSTKNFPDLINVDYVAICSALVRIEALRKVGFMDDRMFIFWDDMDWGLYFKKHKYKVFCATKSIAYHGSFTERERGKLSEFYYGIRNSLLVYSKHTNFFDGYTIFYRTIRNHLRNYIFYTIHKKYEETRLMRKAFLDFMNNNWGKIVLNGDTKSKTSQLAIQKQKLYTEKYYSNIIFSAIGLTLAECKSILRSIKAKCPKSKTTVLVHDDRTEFFKDNNLIIFSKTRNRNLKYIWSTFLNVRRKNFDAAVAMHPHPFLYATRRLIYVNSDGDVNSIQRSGIIYFLFFGLTMFLGEIIAHILFPFVIYKSLKYKKGSNRMIPNGINP